jgi:hypothetical protein
MIDNTVGVDYPEFKPVERLKASTKQEALAYRCEGGSHTFAFL